MTNRNKIFLCAVLLFLLPGWVGAEEMTDFPRVRLQTLDKATARTQTFNARIGSTVKFGPLYIRAQACKKNSPLDKPESAAFLQIWEVDTKGRSDWVFSGWMFASSPGLSSMDHAVYDVWVLDCLDYDQEQEQETVSEDNIPPPQP